MAASHARKRARTFYTRTRNRRPHKPTRTHRHSRTHTQARKLTPFRLMGIQIINVNKTAIISHWSQLFETLTLTLTLTRTHTQTHIYIYIYIHTHSERTYTYKSPFHRNINEVTSLCRIHKHTVVTPPSRYARMRLMRTPFLPTWLSECSLTKKITFTNANLIEYRKWNRVKCVWVCVSISVRTWPASATCVCAC